MLISSINFVNRRRSEKNRREKGDVLKDKAQDLTYCKKQAERISKLKNWIQPQEETDLVSLSFSLTLSLLSLSLSLSLSRILNNSEKVTNCEHHIFFSFGQTD